MQDLLSQAGEASQLTAYLQEEVLYDLIEAYGTYMRENEQSLVRALKTIHSKIGKTRPYGITSFSHICFYLTKTI